MFSTECSSSQLLSDPKTQSPVNEHEEDEGGDLVYEGNGDDGLDDDEGDGDGLGDDDDLAEG